MADLENNNFKGCNPDSVKLIIVDGVFLWKAAWQACPKSYA